MLPENEGVFCCFDRDFDPSRNFAAMIMLGAQL
jgi:hypothetical protein